MWPKIALYCNREVTVSIAVLVVEILIVLSCSAAARSKASVFGRLLAGIAGSNTTGSMDVCLLGVLFVVK